MSSSSDPIASKAAGEEIAIPVILATNPGIKLDYKTMSALDGTKTASVFEHRFRKYKARAQEIIAAKGGDGKAGTIPQGLVPVTPTKKRIKKGSEEDGIEDGADQEETPKKRARAPKKSKEVTTPETAKKIPTTPKSPKTPTTPKPVRTPKAPKSPKAGKVSNGKVMQEAEPETEKADGVQEETPDAAKHAQMAAAGEVFLQEMSFEFENGTQVEEQ